MDLDVIVTMVVTAISPEAAEEKAVQLSASTPLAAERDVGLEPSTSPK